MRGPQGRIWHAFARIADGSRLAINLDMNVHNCPWAKDPTNRERMRPMPDTFAPICHVRDQGRPDANPVVALSFGKFLRRTLDAGGPYWLGGAFEGYGDAEAFTRRG